MQVTSFLFIFSYPSSEWSISIARHNHFLIWCHSSVKWSCLDSSTYLKQALLHRFLSHTKFLSSHLFLIMEREIFTFFYLFFIYSAAAESFKRWVEGESGFFCKFCQVFFFRKMFVRRVKYKTTTKCSHFLLKFFLCIFFFSVSGE